MMPQHQEQLAILAFGSLIWAPEPELDAVVADRIHGVKTPFNVEFARSSSSRGYGPTLVRVKNGGAEVKGMLLAIKDGVTADETTAIMSKRERGAHISRLSDFQGFKTVLFADPVQNIEDPTASALATLAIESIKLSEPGRDGITYLMDAKEAGIVTPLVDSYEKEILLKTSTRSLDRARKLLSRGS